jgi:hypothetical protein
MAIDAETARETRRATTATPKPAAPKPAAPKPTTSTPKLSSQDLRDLANAQAELASSAKQLEELRRQAAGAGVSTTSAAGLTPAEIAAQQAALAAQQQANQQAFLLQQQQQLAAEQALQNRQSAYDLLLAQFSEYGLQSLVEPLRNLITQNVSPSEFTIRLRETEAYKKRFAANADRIKKGLTALNEATYLGLEDKYQGIMRNYGLPATYYSKDSMGRQEGFEKLIANDVSATELEDRILTAQNRVINAPAEVTTALKQFYPGITNGDILAYTLDPEKALTDIKRKVTAAEIGGAAIGAGLATDITRAEELAKYGVTAATARQGYQAAVPLIERGRQLSAFYEESPYTQATAEEELFNLSGAAGAAEKRKKLSSLETAQFGGRSGITGGALARDRAGAY